MLQIGGVIGAPSFTIDAVVLSIAEMAPIGPKSGS